MYRLELCLYIFEFGKIRSSYSSQQKLYFIIKAGCGIIEIIFHLVFRLQNIFYCVSASRMFTVFVG